MAKNTMTFTDNRTGKSYEYNIIDGTRGPSVVDISTFIKIQECLHLTLDILQQHLVSQNYFFRW